MSDYSNNTNYYKIIIYREPSVGYNAGNFVAMFNASTSSFESMNLLNVYSSIMKVFFPVICNSKIYYITILILSLSLVTFAEVSKYIS